MTTGPGVSSGRPESASSRTPEGGISRRGFARLLCATRWADQSVLSRIVQAEVSVSGVRIPRIILSGLLAVAAFSVLGFAALLAKLLVVRLFPSAVSVVGAPSRAFTVFSWTVWALLVLASFGIGYMAQSTLRALARPREVVAGLVGVVILYDVFVLVVLIAARPAGLSAANLVPLTATGLGAALRYARRQRAAAARQALPADSRER
jgi:hypothetical protein